METNQFQAFKLKTLEYLRLLENIKLMGVEITPAKFSPSYINKFDLKQNTQHLVLRGLNAKPGHMYMTDYKTRILAGGTYPGTVTVIEKFVGPSKISSGVFIESHNLILSKKSSIISPKPIIVGMKNYSYNPDYVHKDFHETVESLNKLTRDLEYIKKNSNLSLEDIQLYDQNILGDNPPSSKQFEIEFDF